LEKAENVIAVPKEAIQTANGSSYVVVVNDDGSTENVIVATGISNDAYTEIKSGLNGNETVQYTVTSSSNSGSGFMNRQFNSQGGSGGQMRIQVEGQMSFPGGM
jgi:multidrug efflux pump subunit AcrA (membrane-fusion protein)